jgi:mono/diheme cytochrome c family protein
MRHPRRILTAALIAGATLSAGAAVAADYSGYSGADLYHRFCESCHGRGGRGDGPVASTLAAPLPDLTRIAARHGGKYPDNWVYRVIDGREVIYAHGLREMPVWGVELWREQGADVTAGEKTRDAIASLVEFLKGLQAPRALGDPGH